VLERPWLRALCLLAFVLQVFTAQTALAAAPTARTAAPRQVSPSPSPAAAPDQSQPSAPQLTPGHSATPAGQAPTATSPQAAAAQTNSDLTREVFGYATAGSLGDPTVGYPSWNFDLLSTVAFFAIRATYNGVLVADSNWSVWDSSTLTGLVSTAHAHGVKVVVTVEPLYGSRDQVDFCDTLYNGQTTVDQLVNQVMLKGVDGVNIDYEGQMFNCTNIDPTLNTTSQALMTQFAQKMRAGLDNYKKGLYLSIASYSGSASANDGFFNIPALSQYADSFFVMAYDMDYANQGQPPLQSCTSFCMAPVSPLANYYWNDSLSMSQYSALAGPGKTILGQPYYGRAACVSSPAAHAVATGSVVAATYLDAAAALSSPDVKPGTYTINRDPDDPNGADRWDSWYDNSLGCWREMYWSDVTTLSNRYDLVNQDNLRGVGFWTLNYGGGSAELWNALESHFVACTNATLSGTPASPQIAGTTITLTATSSRCVKPQYQFWMANPGAGWSIVQPYSASPTFTWNTTGAAGGTYALSVWVRDANSGGASSNGSGSWDTYASSQFVLDPGQCTGVTLSTSPASPATAGTPVTLTGTATWCPYPNPLYQFWMAAPGASWQIVQAYSTSATFSWNTSKATAGMYAISVWLRDANSAGAFGNNSGRWDVYSSGQFTLNAQQCSAAMLTTSPPSPSRASTTVTAAGGTSGCTNPLYQFWMASPGGTWQIVQPYSASPTFTWNTTGAAAGTYGLSVWVRDASGSGAYGNGSGRWDTYSSGQYTLTTAPCTAATLSAAPASSTTVGTTVTLTATATGCPNAIYEFWIAAPGGTWKIVQAYSTSATYTWNTTGAAAGTYAISVWVRDTSSVGTSGNSTGRWDAYSSGTYSLR